MATKKNTKQKFFTYTKDDNTEGFLRMGDFGKIIKDDTFNTFKNLKISDDYNLYNKLRMRENTKLKKERQNLLNKNEDNHKNGSSLRNINELDEQNNRIKI